VKVVSLNMPLGAEKVVVVIIHSSGMVALSGPKSIDFNSREKLGIRKSHNLQMVL